MGVKRKWGGSRKGAGRPKAETTKTTVVVRLDCSLLPIIKILKQRHNAGEAIETLIPVTENQNDTQDQIEQYKQANSDLAIQRDNEHLRAVKLVSKVNALQSTVKELREQLERLKNLEHNCQALKKDGSRCTRPAKLKTDYNGIEIHVCLQHNKK